MKKSIGVLAHVDAGKTSFSEQILFHTHAIRTIGRVDHHDAFLDLHPVERERGITVFCDQAVFEIGENRYTWLDTPGHADFVAETERVLPVLDYAVLVVSCPEGVESHTETVWELLRAAGVPVLIFVNKMDRADADFDRCLSEMKRLLSNDIADMRGFDGKSFDDDARERVAETDEELLERLFADDYDFEAWREGLARALRERRIFPVFAGSALRDEGIETFLAAMDAVTDTAYEKLETLPVGGRVFKLRRDDKGQRLVYLKLTQGTLCARDDLPLPGGAARPNELRVVHGAKSRTVQQAAAGDIICVPGLPGVRPGDGVGALCEEKNHLRSEPMLRVAVTAQEGIHTTRLLECLRILEEEDPALGVEYRARTGEVSVRVMGSIQTEILSRLAKDRFGLSLTFGDPMILYMETIAAPAVGIGHYEPLRHYAEAWLRLVPTDAGTGITFKSLCHVDVLALNWQRLIETHVFEKTHPGVLTGAPLTDVRVELLAGRSHLKHTEGGDFRESTYRAIRNALMQAQSVLLEPVCRFSLRVPAEDYGRVMGDLSRMRTENTESTTMGEWTLVEGECPFSAISDYPETFRAATRGRGVIHMRLSRYAPIPSAEQERIAAASNYNPLAEETPDSVFCSHGAGYNVPWNEVRAHAHCEVEL